MYSFASSVLKLGITAYCIRYAILEYKEELKYGYSNFDFLIQIIVFLLIIAIPSVINTFFRWRGFKKRNVLIGVPFILSLDNIFPVLSDTVSLFDSDKS